MNTVQDAFLAVLRASLRGEAPSDPCLSGEDWQELMRLAQQQEVVPLICDAVYCCASFKSLGRENKRSYRELTLQLAYRQIVQSNEFLTLVLHAQAQGLDPVVLKGITVRSLYPKPMLRPSVDEDLLVPPETAEAYHRFFLSEGLTPDEPDAEISAADELSYHKPASPTYIELHTALFPPASDAYGDCNSLFEGALDRAVSVPIEDVTLRALAPTDHLLYLICHAYKHFLHSGVGVRQVCDMGMFAERYGGGIDWAHIVRACASVRIDRFAAALFRIAEKHLGFPMPAAFGDYDVDEGPLLADMLSGGLYGNVDEDRAHSGSITLDAVAAQKQGRERKGLLASAFPPAAALAGRYPYLRRRPWLLPAAWIHRFVSYLQNRETSASASLKIGEERVALLKQYGLID